MKWEPLKSVLTDEQWVRRAVVLLGQLRDPVFACATKHEPELQLLLRTAPLYATGGDKYPKA